jgi:uncharacterized protein (TIGR00251 family)
MILKIRVCPRASRNLVKQDGDICKVYLTKPAQEGQANEQLIKLLAEHFNLKKYQLRILKGDKSRDKLIEIDATPCGK